MNSGISMIETMRDFIERIDGLGIEYMVTGSYAMSAYGEIRMTRDIDVVVRLTEKNVGPFLNRFKDDHYISDESIRRALSRRSMFNIVSHEHGGKIDCIIPKGTAFDRTSFARRYKETVAGIGFWTITREDLVVSKLNWAKDTHSEMQIRDIANLTDAEYDSAYVGGWIDRLDLREIWAEVERWKTQHAKQDK
jgi:hypothetical protein